MSHYESGREAERAGGTVALLDGYRSRRAPPTERWRLADPATTRGAKSSNSAGGYLGVLSGHFAVFDTWAQINSPFEGRFLERIARGAFTRTFVDNRRGMRCLLQHGRDPQVGLNPLGPIRELAEDAIGAAYEVALLPTSWCRNLLPGLRDGLYGASFRFLVDREEVNSAPGKSAHNPDGIVERTIVECKVREFGPVVWGAYEAATANVRSRAARALATARSAEEAQRARQPWRLSRAS